MTRQAFPPGPFEEAPWPTQLQARVVTAEGAARIHGYSVEEDLARHYRLGEVMLLALTGRIPSAEEGAFFEEVLVRLCPVTVAEAPVHAALISRCAGARSPGTLMVGLVGLVEQARHLVESSAPLLEALARPGAGPPPGFEARNDADREAGRALEARWPPGWSSAPPLGELSAEAALLVCLAACGLTAPWQMEAALVAVRLPVLAAEAHAAPLGRLTDYPMNLPPFDYVEPEAIDEHD